MSVDRAALWQALKQHELVQGECPAQEQLESPWYVRLMIGIAGLIASSFLLGFIGSLFVLVFENRYVAMVLGLAMMALAYKVFKGKPGNDFVAVMALVCSLAGQALFAFGVFDIRLFSIGSSFSWFIVGLLQAALAWYMPNSLHRVWSAFAAAMALSIALTHQQIYFIQAPLLGAAVAWIWLNELNWSSRLPVIKPIGYGLTVALLYQESKGLFFNFMWHMASRPLRLDELWLKPWMGEVLIGMTLLVVVWQLLVRHRVAFPGRVANTTLAATLLLVMASLEMTGLGLGLVIILLGFANGNRLLTSIGLVSLLFYLSSYYYLLDNTLLDKSRILLLTGLVLLAAYWIVQRGLFSGTRSEHA
ncbi:MAG: DUF4401 domain-containing protein [Thioalkalispiraceae bacterium]|jgi:uncharacterized membrane protein